MKIAYHENYKSSEKQKTEKKSCSDISIVIRKNDCALATYKTFFFCSRFSAYVIIGVETLSVLSRLTWRNMQEATWW